jgi:NTP-dependent ternary system trypsin peptidase co-occuring protein
MPTKLIRLEDGVLVEAEVPSDQVKQIAGGYADKVKATFQRIEPILLSVCRPLSAAWKEISEEANLTEIQVELGLSFEGEGNLFVTKSKASANLTVKLTLNPLKPKVE